MFNPGRDLMLMEQRRRTLLREAALERLAADVRGRHASNPQAALTRWARLLADLLPERAQDEAEACSPCTQPTSP